MSHSSHFLAGCFSRFGFRWMLLFVASFELLRPSWAGIVINEIHYQPANKTKPEEFLELHNPDDRPVSLEGWRLEDGVVFQFPAGTRLDPGAYLVVAQSPTAFEARFGFTPLGPWTGQLRNTGERVQLRDPQGQLVDEVRYEAGFPWPTEPAGGGVATSTGFSAELIHPSLDRNLGGSWRSSLPPGEGRTFIPAGSADWHYRKGTNEASTPINLWRERDFAEDASWLPGRTSIGFGDSDDNTILSDMRGNYGSVFLRHPFVVESGERSTVLRLRLRVDDGCVVWINGTEVARPHMNPGAFAFDTPNAAKDHEASPTLFEELVLTNGSRYLVEGTNLLALQVFNLDLQNADLTCDVELKGPASPTSPTPGRRNSVYALNAPPAIREVRHTPDQPRTGDTVLITAKVSDPEGVRSVQLSYQVVRPGAFIRRTDAAFTNAANWTFLPMNDAGEAGDLTAGDGVFSAVLPAHLQVHRHLIRYRLHAEDQGAASLRVTVPYPDDGSPNFAYFVYDGIPAWTGASKPTAPNATAKWVFPESVMRSLPAYHLLANATDVINSQYNPSFDGVRMAGALILRGKVYDHITYYNHGANSTYVSGKNKWRMRANRAHKFKMQDDYGRAFQEDWDEFNLEGCLDPWGAVNRGMAGVDEAVSLRAYQLAGVACPNFHYLQFRIIDDATEASPTNQYEGDLWGLYLAKETPDGSFLDERGLPDGNIFRIELNTPYQKNQGPTQPENGSDWNTFLDNGLSRTANNAANLAWWQSNLHLPTYYSGRAIDRLVGNVDLREGANYYFYHHPDNHWYYVPWDLDLMFIPTLMNSGTIDQKNCLLMTPLKIEFANRCREILDLFASDPAVDGGQIGQLIDEYAQIVNPTGQALTWADVDECMWNWHPRSQGSGENTGFTSHRGNFYRTPFIDVRGGTTWTRVLTNAVNGHANHEAYVRHMIDYATDTYPPGRSWSINNGNPRGYGYKFLEQESRDTGVPLRPTLSYIGPAGYPADALRFAASSFAGNASGSAGFAARQWRMGEISAPGLPLYDKTQPRRYEIESAWVSPELTNADAQVDIPVSVLRPGHTYRARIRQKDLNGRWSRWSEPIQFVAGTPDVGHYVRDLSIAEVMYHPAEPTPAERAAGFSQEDFEFVRLLNIGSSGLDLSAIEFTKGVDFQFPPLFHLRAGQSVYVVRNRAAFSFRYGPALEVGGEYQPDNLANSGERLKLSYGAGTAIVDFSYATTPPWPSGPDGQGYSLELIHPEQHPDPSQASSWRARLSWPAWAARHGGISDPTSDADGDGLTALLEYALGLDPNQRSSAPWLTVEENGAQLQATLSRDPAATDVLLTLEFSTDLVSWDGGPTLLRSVLEPEGRVRETWLSPLPFIHGAQFVRVRVTDGR